MKLLSSEILNIEYHTRRLTLKALNKSESIQKAAEVLGIHERSLYNMIIKYGIEWNGVAYVTKKQMNITIVKTV